MLSVNSIVFIHFNTSDVLPQTINNYESFNSITDAFSEHVCQPEYITYVRWLSSRAVLLHYLGAKVNQSTITMMS